MCTIRSKRLIVLKKTLSGKRDDNHDNFLGQRSRRVRKRTVRRVTRPNTSDR